MKGSFRSSFFLLNYEAVFVNNLDGSGHLGLLQIEDFVFGPSSQANCLQGIIFRDFSSIMSDGEKLRFFLAKTS